MRRRPGTKSPFITCLTHTSGIPSFTGFPEYKDWELKPTTPAELVARFRDKPLEFDPGTKWNYSNYGYALLGYLVEKVSGQTYQQFLQENILHAAWDERLRVRLQRADPSAAGPPATHLARTARKTPASSI